MAGAAFLAATAVVLQWRSIPAAWRVASIEFALVVIGVVLLIGALASYVLDRRGTAPPAPAKVPKASPTSESSLMALPALVTNGSPPVSSSPPPVPSTAPARTRPSAASAPVGLTASSTNNSTLLIPFAGGPTSMAPASPALSPEQSVSRLVGRMGAIQRVAPTATSSGTAAIGASVEAPKVSPLLLRLTRIPSPPAGASPASGDRRCNDCAQPLGSPPHFEPCADCGRALCERCYWRTSSGPDAHMCTACVRDRSVPKPPTPVVTFAKPRPVAAVAGPSGQSSRLRRPGN